MNNRYHIKHVAISITDLDDAAEQITKKAGSELHGYVCVACVRSVYVANHNPEYCQILNRSFLTLPDGKPLEWYARFAGYKQVRRCSGPDLFERICQLSEHNNYTHFFFGSTPEIIKKMQENLLKKFPKLKIVGAVSPPFAPVQELANDEIVRQINTLKPTFVWIGLGAPKQEQFINLIIDRIESSLLIGVGLVFDYQAGSVKRAPGWMQKSGLEGFYRDFQQPERINRRTYSMLFSIIPLLFSAFIQKKIMGRIL